MKDAFSELHPSRVVARRMHELEAELERARAYRRQHSKSPDTLGRWRLEQPETPQQEEGWFITYLDMMTLLLVVMIVMLAFSGAIAREPTPSALPPTASSPETPAPDIKPPPATQADHGPLSGDSGLLPGHVGLADTVALSEASEAGAASENLSAVGQHPADIGPLPDQARLPLRNRPLPPVGRSSELYPGWSSTDLAASFIGPPRPAPAPTAPAPAQTEPEIDPTAAPDTPSEGETLAAGLSLGELGSDVEVLVSERSVSFRVNSEILFDSSQADLSRSGLSVLRRIVSVLSSTNHLVTVEGHTDSVAVRRNVRYPSNWELSSARAGSVVRYLQANGIERGRLKAVGYADTRPIADNNTPDGRASNRRVELIIEKKD